MTDKDEKKGFFDKVADAFTSKEKKEEQDIADKKAADLEKRLKDKAAEERIAKGRKAAEERREKIEAARKPEIIATHVVDEENPTLSHIALKYYKHATPPYWQYLLEHNTEVLKGSEKNVRVGMELEIPELPEELKDK